MTTQVHNWETLVVGLGQTGLSVARHLHAQGVAFAVVDSRANPPGKDELFVQFPDIPYFFGAFAEVSQWFTAAATLVVSPGIAIATPEIRRRVSAVRHSLAISSYLCVKPKRL